MAKGGLSSRGSNGHRKSKRTRFNGVSSVDGLDSSPFRKIPEELLVEIFQLAITDGQTCEHVPSPHNCEGTVDHNDHITALAIKKTCKHFNRVAVPIHLSTVTCAEDDIKFADMLKRNPSHARHCRCLSLQAPKRFKDLCSCQEKSCIVGHAVNVWLNQLTNLRHLEIVELCWDRGRWTTFCKIVNGFKQLDTLLLHWNFQRDKLKDRVDFSTLCRDLDPPALSQLGLHYLHLDVLSILPDLKSFHNITKLSLVKFAADAEGLAQCLIRFPKLETLHLQGPAFEEEVTKEVFRETLRPVNHSLKRLEILDSYKGGCAWEADFTDLTELTSMQITPEMIDGSCPGPSIGPKVRRVEINYNGDSYCNPSYHLAAFDYKAEYSLFNFIQAIAVKYTQVENIHITFDPELCLNPDPKRRNEMLSTTLPWDRFDDIAEACEKLPFRLTYIRPTTSRKIWAGVIKDLNEIAKCSSWISIHEYIERARPVLERIVEKRTSTNHFEGMEDAWCRLHCGCPFAPKETRGRLFPDHPPDFLREFDREYEGDISDNEDGIGPRGDNRDGDKPDDGDNLDDGDNSDDGDSSECRLESWAEHLAHYRDYSSCGRLIHLSFDP